MKYFSFLAVPVLLLTGCAFDSTEGQEPVEADGEEVIGVTDLTAMEAQLGLTKDRKDAQGRWGRGDALLKNGDCYKQTVGKPGGSASWEFRRYANGAAFFRKLGTEPGTSDYRPVTCVDVDVKVGSQKVTHSLSGLVLDSTLRYQLGKGYQDEGAAGHAYLSFARGGIEVADAERYCGFQFGGNDPSFTPSEPALLTAKNTMEACLAADGAEDACYTKALAACKRAANADIKANPLARPANDGQYIYGLQVQGPNGNSAFVSAQLAELAYRYAWKKATKKDVFTEAGDAVGSFQRLDQSTSVPVLSPGGVVILPEAIERARFSKLDIHRVITPQPGGVFLEQLYVTKKNNDASPATNALAQCFRAVVPNTPSADFVCSGL